MTRGQIEAELHRLADRQTHVNLLFTDGQKMGVVIKCALSESMIVDVDEADREQAEGLERIEIGYDDVESFSVI